MRVRKLDIDYTQHDFQFCRNWFRYRNLPTFREYVYPEWAGKPITYLEIGVFEGMSLVWMMQRILTHEDSRGVGCDPWLMMPKWTPEKIEWIRQHAIHNTKSYPRCTLIRSTSDMALRSMVKKNGFVGIKRNSVDLLMIDGNHGELLVLNDARLCFQLAKPGGWMLFDDVENKNNRKHHVKQGLAMFLEEVGDKVKFLWKHNFMEAYQKVID